MTNEEIEKRFEFDLKIGLFKSLSQIINGTEYNKKTYAFRSFGSNLGNYNLCDLLDNIGYKTKRSIYELLPSDLKTILVFPENKRYEVHTKYAHRTNAIPQYVFNYQPYIKENNINVK